MNECILFLTCICLPRFVGTEKRGACHRPTRIKGLLPLNDLKVHGIIYTTKYYFSVGSLEICQYTAMNSEHFILPLINVTLGVYYRKCIYDESTDIYYFTK